MLKRQKVNQVIKIIMETGQWHGYIVACKVNEWHINHGWHIGCPVEFTIDSLITEYDDNSYMPKFYPPTNDVMSKVVKMVKEKRQSYEWYNCVHELGHYAVFYQEI